jgi:hypothetical protein
MNKDWIKTGNEGQHGNINLQNEASGNAKKMLKNVCGQYIL